MSKKDIEYRLNKIETVSFKTDYTVFNAGNTEHDFAVTTNYQADDKTYSIGLTHQIDFEHESEKPFLSLKVQFVFLLNEYGWSKFYEGNTLTLPVGLIRIFNNISLGTSRGIIHTKTENSPLNNIIMPPIVLENIVKEDISFEFPKP